MRLFPGSLSLTLLSIAALSADIIEFKDGRKLEGTVTEEGEKVKIRTRFGEYSFSRSDIVEIIKSDTKEKGDALEAPKAQATEKTGPVKKTSGKGSNEAEVLPPGEFPREKPKGAVKPPERSSSGREAAAAAGKQVAVEITPEARQKAKQLHRQAATAIEEERYDLAIELLNQALELDSENASCWYSRGCVYYVLRQTEEALADLNKGLELAPGNINPLYARASVWFALGELGKAIEDLEEVVKIEPGHEAASKQRDILILVRDGPNWKRKFVRETAHYRVTTDSVQKIADLAARELERIYKEYARQFHFTGDEQKRKFNVRVFSTEKGFLDYSEKTTGQSLSFALGYYAPSYKELVLKDNPKEKEFVETLYHEGFHQFLDYFISNVPSWFNEGLAEYFEKAQQDGKQFKMGGVDLPGLQLIQKAIQQNDHVPLKKLLQISQGSFVDGSPSGVYESTMAQLHYAESWSFIHFLIHSQKGKYRRVIRDFYLALKAGKKPDEAFEEVFGKANFSRVDEAWKEYVKEMPKDKD